MATPLWVVCKDSEGSGCFHVVRSLAAAAAVPATEDEADRVGALKTSRLSQKGMRVARARARALSATGGIYDGEPNDTFIYSSTSDQAAPFVVFSEVRKGDKVWVVTSGEGGHIWGIAGIWLTEVEADEAMQKKVDYIKTHQHDAAWLGPQYDLAHFPIGAPWTRDTGYWLFALIVE